MKIRYMTRVDLRIKIRTKQKGNDDVLRYCWEGLGENLYCSVWAPCQNKCLPKDHAGKCCRHSVEWVVAFEGFGKALGSFGRALGTCLEASGRSGGFFGTLGSILDALSSKMPPRIPKEFSRILRDSLGILKGFSRNSRGQGIVLSGIHGCFVCHVQASFCLKESTSVSAGRWLIAGCQD